MTIGNDTTHAEVVWTGYFIAGGITFLTLFHLGFLALVLSIPGILILQRLSRRTNCAVVHSHLRWQSRTIWILVLAMAGFITWIICEVSSIAATNFIEIFAVHWIAHTILSISISIWMLMRIVRGILRFSDNASIG
jgi:uncharacterized membrane protein